MSGTEFLQLMKVANQATVEEKVEDDEDKYAYGIAGIAEIFHCSLPTANRPSPRLVARSLWTRG